ncbi:formate dehydrogenase accessory sulfurtransferase FdhD [Anaerolinea thermophila]|nr:formate dehydrogenase accessory sulfurtransferase FdhD [Anaerolinea thermophila]
MAQTSRRVFYWQYQQGEWQALSGEVIAEQAVTLTVNGEEWITLMCTPHQLEALAVGFLYNEGLIQSLEEVAILQPCENEHNVDIWLTHALSKPRRWRRTSGCTGGMTQVDGEEDLRVPFWGQAQVEAEQIIQWMEELYRHQELYHTARGVHASALSDGERVVVQCEDIGRHNTLDKLSGWVLLNNFSGAQRIVLTTGRISSEMLQKSARLGAGMVVSRTSPTSASVALAERWGITLIGYARRNRLTVYTHLQRLKGAPVDLPLTSGIAFSPSENPPFE